MSHAQAHGDAPDPAHDEHAEHAAHAGGHEKHHHEEHGGHGQPPWLMSFGDMMTLFLCFFIMLVTMAKSQDAGLIAAGLGPFVAALENRGMDGALDGAEVLQRVNTYRQRFGLAPLDDPEYLVGASELTDARGIEQTIKDSLRPYVELGQPLLATFEPDSALLSPTAARYLDLLAETLRPGLGQVLVLEGHADDAGSAFARDNAWLAAARAQAVRAHLVDHHGYVPTRVEARAWALALRPMGSHHACVDARLMQPSDAPTR